MYEGMENTMEDLTINQEAARFQAQQSAQQRANILQALAPGTGPVQQTVSPMPQTNPYLQAAGAVGSLGVGLGSLIG